MGEGWGSCKPQGCPQRIKFQNISSLVYDRNPHLTPGKTLPGTHPLHFVLSKSKPTKDRVILLHSLPITLSLPRMMISSFPCSFTRIWHHTVWRIWLFIAHSKGWLLYQYSLHHLWIFSLKGGENVLFESEGHYSYSPIYLILSNHLHHNS